MYVFLDLDGVLAREDRPEDDEELMHFDTECLSAFEAVIREYDDIKIVIASPWREIFALDDICALFSADIAAHICGAAPLASNPNKYYRYYEIVDYLESQRVTEEPWLVIASQRDYFPPHTLIIAPDPNRGFGAVEANELKQFLDSFSQARADITPEVVGPESGVLGLAWDSTAVIYPAAFAILAKQFNRCVVITLNDELSPETVAQVLQLDVANVVVEICPDARISDAHHWKAEICRLHAITLMFDADVQVIQACQESGIQAIGTIELETY